MEQSGDFPTLRSATARVANRVLSRSSQRIPHTRTSSHLRCQAELVTCGELTVVELVNAGAVALSMPMVGAYAASKFALETAAAAAMQMELRPWGIGVVVVEPAQTDTDLWRKADDMVTEVEAALTPEHQATYNGSDMPRVCLTLRAETVL